MCLRAPHWLNTCAAQVVEFCDRGSLSDAVDQGLLRTRRAPAAPPDLPAVLFTCLDVARGLRYLHAQGVVHGRLWAGNVMLQSRPPATLAAAGAGSAGGKAPSPSHRRHHAAGQQQQQREGGWVSGGSSSEPLVTLPHPRDPRDFVAKVSRYSR